MQYIIALIVEKYQRYADAVRLIEKLKQNIRKSPDL